MHVFRRRRLDSGGRGHDQHVPRLF
jgi:hypothetical protein